MSSMNFIAQNKQVLIGVTEIISVVKHILKITIYLLESDDVWKLPIKYA